MHFLRRVIINFLSTHSEEEALVGTKSLANLSIEVPEFSHDGLLSSIAQRNDSFDVQSKLLLPVITKALIAQGLAVFTITVKIIKIIFSWIERRN